ncbi:MAG: hypothetical protein SGI73_22925 [Chloroflexota bacterium]|nr:hypothetical protein [Chloroflexota bacterium]
MQADRKTHRWWVIRVVPTMIIYVLTIICIYPFSQVFPDSPWRFAIAVLPALPIGVGVWFFIGYLRRMDELQQKIQLEAIGFSSGVTGLINFTIGLLETAGLARQSLIWVFPMLIGFWGLGQIIARRRYE